MQSSLGNTNGAARGSHHVEDRASNRSSYDPQPAYQLPIHSGPPPSRNSYSPPNLSPAMASPYAASKADTRRGYSHGGSHSLPTPPMSYHSGPNSRAASYAPPDHYRNGDPGCGGQYYGDGRVRDSRSAGSSAYQSTHHTYPSVHYGYPPPPPTNGDYAVHHQYQNGYHHGSVSFESDDSGGQAPRRRRGNLPRDTTDMLKQWFADHLGHPYPTEDEKQMLCRQTGLQMTQVSLSAKHALSQLTASSVDIIYRSAIGSLTPGVDGSRNW